MGVRGIPRYRARCSNTRMTTVATGGRAACFSTTVAVQRAANIHVHDGVGQAEFVAMRTARDATFAMPQPLLPAVQVDMRGGALPAPESNGVRSLKIPLDAL